jgi:hypothetical protein
MNSDARRDFCLALSGVVLALGLVLVFERQFGAFGLVFSAATGYFFGRIAMSARV